MLFWMLGRFSSSWVRNESFLLVEVGHPNVWSFPTDMSGLQHEVSARWVVGKGAQSRVVTSPCSGNFVRENTSLTGWFCIPKQYILLAHYCKQYAGEIICYFDLDKIRVVRVIVSMHELGQHRAYLRLFYLRCATKTIQFRMFVSPTCSICYTVSSDSLSAAIS